MKPSIAIITTCMGRAFHLRQSLPKMLSQNYEDYVVIVVDWSSPDDLQQYIASINSLKLHCAKIQDKKWFSLTGARNAGGEYLLHHGLAPDYIAFVDADILLPPDFLENNLSRLLPKKCYMQRNKTLTGDLGIWGSCICLFEAWQSLRYNEEISTYGEEDNEFYEMLKKNGNTYIPLDTRDIEIIQHSDALRMQFYQEKPEDIPNLKRQNKLKFRTRKT